MSIKRVAIKTIIVIAIIMLFRSMFVSPIVTKSIAFEVGQTMAAHDTESEDESDPYAVPLRSVVMTAIMDRESRHFWTNTVIDLIILLILISAFYQLYRLDKADEQTVQA